MTPNAFTIPAKAIQIRQQSPKQRKDAATRVNRHEPLCTKYDNEKTKRISRSDI